MANGVFVTIGILFSIISRGLYLSFDAKSQDEDLDKKLLTSAIILDIVGTILVAMNILNYYGIIN